MAFAEEARPLVSSWPRVAPCRAAGVARVRASSIEVAQNMLTETQSAILPLVPHLETLRPAFIAAALASN